MNEIIINGFSFPNIDCYHNLILYSLASNGYDIGLLGAHWPWQFNCSSNHLTSKKMISHSLIKNVYDISLRRSQFCNTEQSAVYKTLEEQLSSSSLLFVGVSQLPHTRLLREENHSIIIESIDKEYATCIDTIPVFYGKISTNYLLQSISHISSPWYAYLEFPQEDIFIDEATVLKNYINEIQRIAWSYRQKKTDGSLTTYDILLKIIHAKASNDRKSIIDMCSGKWGWHIERNAGLFSRYLNTDCALRHYGTTIFDNLELIENISKLWGIAYKQLYMATIVKEDKFCNILERTVNIFEKIVDVEFKLISKLLG